MPVSHNGAFRRVLVATVALLACVTAQAAESSSFTHTLADNRLEIRLGDVTIGHYVFTDPSIPRPHWTGMRAPSGERITRVHPPNVPDYNDHPTMHPGIWMAFGDINGVDFWRNKAAIEHLGFVERPWARDGRFGFSVENAYKNADGVEICRERTSFTIQAIEHGYLLDWTSTFSAVDSEVIFGDQEEMGLGFRVARPISVDPGQGTIENDRSEKNESEIWGKPARWCVYSGIVDTHRLGIMVIPHPQNFRASWMHARDYGFLAANPFGRNAMTGGEPSTVRIAPGSSLTLRFGLYIFAAPVANDPEYDSIYEAYANGS